MTIQRTRLAPAPVFGAGATLMAALVPLAGRYGYHRDELYFRMLPPALGYLDQPPFTPWLARNMTHLGDRLWVLRLPATVVALASVIVIALVVCEVGGSTFAQGLAAWGYAFATMTLTFGHVLLTASADLLIWPLVILLVLRAVLRAEARWWLLAGLVIGLSTYNKWLVTVLVISLVGGLLIAGPRRVLISPAVWCAAGIALVVASPNIVWQLTHGLPQVEMGRALARDNGAGVRFSTLPMLLVMVGPLLFAFVVAGMVRLFRAAEWRPIRFLAVALLMVIGLTLLGGSQNYYPYGVLSVVFAVGCVPAAAFAQRSRGRVILVLALMVLHILSNVLISLPVIPLSVLAQTFVPTVNPGVADQIGWPAYVSQVDAVLDDALRADPGTVVLASNYGEAGAMVRFSRHRDVPVVSGLNALGDLGGPPPGTATVVVVGGQLESITSDFARCTAAGRLSSGTGVDNEEEDQPIAICSGPNRSWAELWPTMRHLG